MIDAGTDRPRGRPRRAHQHGAADLLLRDLGRARARAGDRADQGVDREDLRPARRRGRGAQPARRSTRALEGLHKVELPGRVTAAREPRPLVPAHAPEFVRTVTAAMMAGRGDELPVSALPVDGTYPSGTTAYEKRNISELVAVWDPDICIQCGNCSFVCPHSVIRSRLYEPARAGRRARRASDRRRSTHPASRTPVHAAGVRRGLHRLRAVRRGLPGVGGREPGPQGDQPRRARAAGRAPSARTSRSSSSCRAATARGSTSAPCAARSSSSRCSSSPAPAPAAARRRT